MKMIPNGWRQCLPANVWIIATMVNQDEFDRDWPKLREIPANVRGLSIEPILGPIHFRSDVQDALHWAIYGGESTQQARARECHVEWIQDGIEQCRALRIAPFVKQLGSRATVNRLSLGYGTGKHADPAEWRKDLRVQEFPHDRGK